MWTKLSKVLPEPGMVIEVKAGNGPRVRPGYEFSVYDGLVYVGEHSPYDWTRFDDPSTHLQGLIWAQNGGMWREANFQTTEHGKNLVKLIKEKYNE